MNTFRILIMYHSGSGSTRTISEVFRHVMAGMYEIDLREISLEFEYHILEQYDLLLIGFPTYHCRPSRSIVEFVEKMPVLSPCKPVFVFTTYGLYPGNSVRILSKQLASKGLMTGAYMEIRGPASDGALIFPAWLSVSAMFSYERSARQKIMQAISAINRMNNRPIERPQIPAYKWYVPLNWPNQYFGEKHFQKYVRRITILKELCTNCQRCVKSCLRHCWVPGEHCPVFEPENCEFCVKCIHNCPQKAIIFSENMRNKPHLNKTFYEKLKQQLQGDYLR